MSEFRYFAYTDFQFQTNRSQNLVDLPFSPYQPTKRTETDEISPELNVPYTVFEVLVAIFTVIGNLMVIIVFQRERKLRRRTNYYIVSLAMADFLVGSLGIPFAILASVGKPTNLLACLFTVSLLVVLCTISIFCLVAVSVDRYWAILYPMAYSRNVRTRTAIIIISLCWVAGSVVGFLPLFGWHADVSSDQACLFVKVMDYNYLVFLYFATIITPAILMLAFYAHIYRVIVKQVRQIVTMNPMSDSSRRSSTAQIHLATQPGRGCHGGTMLRVLGTARKRDVKATQNLSIIVLFFMICWIPLYTINCITAFCPDCYIHPKFTIFGIILSHLNSAVNPVLYAYHLKDFRAALKNLILKVMGIETEPNMEAMHRFSVASQHRLQSMDASMRHNSLQPRIYVDSPIYLRQQQQTLKHPKMMPKCGVVTPCLTNSIGTIHQTVAAVASVPTDIEREMWSIMEASSGAELGEIHYEFPDFPDSNNSTPVPPKRLKRHRRTLSAKTEKSCDSPYLYDNRNYSTGPEDDDECDYDEVFLPQNSTPKSSIVDSKKLNDSIIACAMREKLRFDDGDYQNRVHLSLRALTDSSHSDYEVSKPTTTTTTVSQSPPIVSKHASLTSPIHSNNPNPMLASKRTPILARSESLSQSSSSNTCLANSLSSVFVIDDADDKNPLSPGNKPKFRKTPSLQKSTRAFSRTCTYSDSSAPLQPNPVKLLSHSTSSNSSSSQSIGIISANGNIHSNGNNSKNTQTTNNLNYYTIHQPNHQSIYHQQNQSEKFSPLKAMSNLIFPPIVKHSSLFQLFQPSTTNSSSATDSTTASKPSEESQNAEESTESTATTTDLVVVEKPNVTSVVSPTES